MWSLIGCALTASSFVAAIYLAGRSERERWVEWFEGGMVGPAPHERPPGNVLWHLGRALFFLKAAKLQQQKVEDELREASQ